jgi:hypothetical protein
MGHEVGVVGMSQIAEKKLQESGFGTDQYGVWEGDSAVKVLGSEIQRIIPMDATESKG